MISIIIPIYNAERYLKKCLDSVLSQTYKDLEIVLVNDGSTDGSVMICREYEEKDARIVFISKENEGQGKARNIGLEKCRGEYVVFVDSDDWIHPEMLEKLCRSLEDWNSNIAICNYYRTKLDSERETYLVEEKLGREGGICLGDEITENKKALAGLSTYPWGKIYRKSLFLENNLFFPSHFYEDAALIPLLYAKADRLSFVCDGLYYYRNRSGSTVNQVAALDDRIECMKTLVCNFRKQGLLDKYREALNCFFEERIQVNLRTVRSTLRLKYEDFEKKQQEWFDTEWPHVKSMKRYPKICTFGSYNLMIIAKQIMGYESDRTVEDYYGRQGLISCMSRGEELNEHRVFHDNPMKRKCLIGDFSKKFRNMNPEELIGMDFVFVDFMEERFNTGCYKGEYFTVSDAWLDIKDSISVTYTETEAFSGEWFTLWKEAAGRFLKHLLRSVKPEQIILVRMTLSEQYEENGVIKDFPNREIIHEMNRHLEECYDYFISLNDGIQGITVNNLPYYKTSAAFRHGCFPWHLGNEAYRLLAGEVRGRLR